MAIIVFPCDCPKWTLIFLFFEITITSFTPPLSYLQILPYTSCYLSNSWLLFLTCCYIHVCTCISVLKHTDTTCSVCIMSLGCMFSVWSILVLAHWWACSFIFTAPFQREKLQVQPYTAFPVLGFPLAYTRAIPPLPLAGTQVPARID